MSVYSKFLRTCYSFLFILPCLYYFLLVYNRYLCMIIYLLSLSRSSKNTNLFTSKIQNYVMLMPRMSVSASGITISQDLSLRLSFLYSLTRLNLKIQLYTCRIEDNWLVMRVHVVNLICKNNTGTCYKRCSVPNAHVQGDLCINLIEGINEISGIQRNSKSLHHCHL